jgi:hypothetical protein
VDEAASAPGCSDGALFQLELDQFNPGRAHIPDGAGVAVVLPVELAELDRPGTVAAHAPATSDAASKYLMNVLLLPFVAILRAIVEIAAGRCGFPAALARAARTGRPSTAPALAGAAQGDIIGWHGFCETTACETLDRGPRVGMKSPEIASA